MKKQLFILVLALVSALSAMAGDCPGLRGSYVCSQNAQTLDEIQQPSDADGIYTLRSDSHSFWMRNEEASWTDAQYKTDNPDGNWQVLWTDPTHAEHQYLEKVSCENNVIMATRGAQYHSGGDVVLQNIDEFTALEGGNISYRATTIFTSSPNLVSTTKCFHVSWSWIAWAKLRGLLRVVGL